MQAKCIYLVVNNSFINQVDFRNVVHYIMNGLPLLATTTCRQEDVCPSGCGNIDLPLLKSNYFYLI